MPARYAAVDSADLLGGRAATVRIGYASRESGKCKSGRDCGGTVAPFHACCTEETRCVSLTLNARCCEVGKDCSSRLDNDNEAQCANEENDLYFNDGYFCCDQTLKGYRDGSADGCAAQDYVLKGIEEWLLISQPGKASGSSSKSTGAPSATNPGNTSKTSSSGHTSATNPSQTSGHASSTGTTTTGSSTPTVGGDSSPSPTSPSAGAPSSTDSAAGKTSNTGAIAGGVIGGIAVLALLALLVWFLRRRKARSYASTAAPQSPSGAYHAVEGQGPEKDVPLGAMAKSASQAEGGVSELPDKDKGGDAGAAAELYGQEGKRVAEMDTPRGQGPAEMYSPGVVTTPELHGTERGPGELPAWDGKGVPAQLKVGDRGGPAELP